MSCILSRAQELVQLTLHVLLNEQNIENFLSCLSSEFFLVGPGKNEPTYDREVAAAILQRQIASHPEIYLLSDKQYHPVALSPDLCCVITEIYMTSSNNKTDRITESWVVRQYPDGAMKIVHVHLTSIYINPENPSFYFTDEMLQFHDRISDGVAKVVYGAQRQVLYMSDRLIELFGYSRECIAKNNYRTVDYIVEDDLPIVKAAVDESLATRQSYSVRYRVRHKKGKIIWIKVNGLFMNETYLDDPVYYCIFTNITELMDANERLVMEKERYRILTELSDGITFEYDLHTDIFKFPNRYEQYFDLPKTIQNFRSTFNAENKNQTCDDFSQLASLFSKDITDTTAEVQLKTRSRNLEWFSATLCTLRDESSTVIKTIGKLTNINQQKLAQIDLENKSKHDLMTNLFNKITTEYQIKNYLSEMPLTSLAAFLMIDIDNFKAINDRMGHFVGDHVLSSIADHMKRIFRNTDILGRFGGDEFIVLMKDIKDEFLVREKAAKLSQNVLDSYDPDTDGYQVTLSLGITIIQGNRPHSYQRVFQKADKALYIAKNSGKNQFAVYNEWMDTTKLSIHSQSRGNTSIEFSEQQQSYLTVVNTALDILLHANGPQNATSEIFQYLGKFLDLRKAYAAVFTQNQIQILAQWVKPGSTSLPEYLPLTKHELLVNFNRSGMVLCSDISTLAPLKTICERLGAEGLLQCLIYQNDETIGLIGLGCCGVQRIWTQNEIDILQTVTKVLTKPITALICKQSIVLDTN